MANCQRHPQRIGGRNLKEEEEEVPEEIWRFPKIGSKKQRSFYVSESMIHPAKMDVALTRRLIKEFVPKGATILDPMAGVGTTGVEGILLGRNVLLIDIEKKFTKLARKNIQNVKKTNRQSHFKLKLGKATIITGDSRDLKQLLQEHADSIITSPPFAEANRGAGIAQKGYTGKHGRDPKLHLRHDRPLSDNPGNISNLPFEENVDTVVTSPPYPEAYKSSSKTREEQAKRLPKKLLVKNPKGGGALSLFTSEKNVAAKGFLEGMPPNPKNIGNLPIGSVESIITSPPFSSSLRPNPKANKQKRIQRLKEVHKRNKALGKKWGLSTDKALEREFERQDSACGTNPKNIGSLPHGKVDAIITSPPYSEGIGHSLGANIGKTIPEPIKQTKSFKSKVALGLKHELIKHASKGNIGSITEHGDVRKVVGAEKSRKRKK